MNSLTRFAARRLAAFSESVLALLMLRWNILFCEFFLEGGWVIVAVFLALILALK